MGVLKGDFIGFTFGGVHSSTLGLIRVSDGSRYTDNLLPTFQDITNEVAGRNETNFFGSYYNKRDISIKVAFDTVTEDQMRGIRQLFGEQSIKDLIFDETPYKVYRAKVGQNLSLSHVCFDEDGKRVYKGDGTISFSCFFPFAKSRYKFLNEYENDSTSSIKVPEWVEDNLIESSDQAIVNYGLIYYKNKDEWKDSSGMAGSKDSGPYDNVGTGRGNILLLNPGDIDTDCIITLRGELSGTGYLYNLKIALSSDEQYRIVINNTVNRNSSQVDPNYEDPLDVDEPILDQYIQINTRNNLIEGVSKVGGTTTYVKTGRIYNQYMTTGVFFKVPVIKIGSTDHLIITDSAGVATNIKGYVDSIEYDYLYY